MNIKKLLQYKDINLLRKNMQNEGLFLCIYLLILPVFFTFYNNYFDIGENNIWTANYPYWRLFIIGGIGGALSIFNKKWILPALAFIIFYGIHAMGVDDPFWKRNLEIAVLVMAISTFAWLAYWGKVRSLSFLILIIYSLFAYTKGFTLLLGLSYTFFHFLFFVVKDNWTVFTILGWKKAAFFMGKSFLYWCPMLLFIVPLKYAQNHIKNKVSEQLYSNTLVDTTQFSFNQSFPDSIAKRLILDENKTTILFIEKMDSIKKKPKTKDSASPATPAKKDSRAYHKKLKSKLLGTLGGIYKQAEKLVTDRVARPPKPKSQKRTLKQDTLAYDLITHVLPKYDRLQKRYCDIFLSKLSPNPTGVIQILDDYKLIRSLESKGELKIPFVLVLQDFSLKQADHTVSRLQANLEISVLLAIKRMELAVLQKIEEKTKKIDFSKLKDLDKKGKSEIESHRKAIMKQIDDHQKITLLAVKNQVDEFFPEPLFEIKKCKFWQIAQLIENAIKKNINAKYAKEKQALNDAIAKKINNFYKNLKIKINLKIKKTEQGMDTLASNIDADALAAGTVDFSQLLNKELKKATDKATMKIMDQIQLLFGSWFFYSLIGTIAFYFLVVQTFLYIFARISISKENNLFASLNTTGKTLPQGSIKKCGDTYTIPVREKQVYYVSRIYEPSGIPPRFSIPFKSVSIYSRLKTRAYTMNKVDMNHNKSSVQFRATGSSEFVEWTLLEGEEVVFDYRNFVAVTDTITLKSDISSRVTTLILGRLFYKIALGPGKLILMTKGRPIISGEKASNNSLPQNRILAWNKGTNFDVDSEMGITDVYLSGFYLQKRPGDLIIIDADAKGKVKLGLVQYIKGLIWPF